MAKTYECRNAKCSLGTAEQPGRFTGGLTKEGAAVLGVDPGKAGPGVCPNCGEKGREVSS